MLLHVADRAGSVLDHKLLAIKPVVPLGEVPLVLSVLPLLVGADRDNIVMEIVDLPSQVDDLGAGLADNDGLAEDAVLIGLDEGVGLDGAIEVVEFACQLVDMLLHVGDGRGSILDDLILVVDGLLELVLLLVHLMRIRRSQRRHPKIKRVDL